ncbi:MAG: hypothetical protein U0441_30030 [Polyangiaceae bacterium]
MHDVLPFGRSAHTVARKSDGTVWSWGNDVLGQLGDGGPFTGFSATPVQAIGLGGVTAVATNVYHTVALKSDGTVWDWANLTGQIGDGTTTDRDAPFHVPGLTGMIGVSAGWCITIVALKSDGTVWTGAATAKASSETAPRTTALTRCRWA